MSKAYQAGPTSKRFYVPPTLAADFTEFLDNDIPNTVMDFELLKSWFDQFQEGYEKELIRGELYSDKTKSRYNNTDNNMNIRCDVASGIKKGDMLVSENGEVFLLDWEVAKQNNNAPSRALRCNFNLTVKRHRPEKTDEAGYLIESEGEDVVVDNMPCNGYRYDGRPEYSAIAATPGVTPKTLILVTAQFNEQTKKLRVDDTFEWGIDTYQIIDVGYNGISLSGDYGCLSLQAQKVAGGML